MKDLELLPTWVKWLARDFDGGLWGYQNKPHKDVSHSDKYNWCWCSDGREYNTHNHSLYSEVKWEDTEPFNIKYPHIKKNELTKITKEQFMAYAESHNLVIFEKDNLEQQINKIIESKLK